VLTIYDPIPDDPLGKARGGGRAVKILRESLGENARFVSDLHHVAPDDTLLIPVWQPFHRPYLFKKIAARQILMIFDVIPLKYPEHFPIGLKGRWWMMHNLRTLSLYDRIVTISEISKRDIVDYLNIDPHCIDVVYLTTSKALYRASKATSRKTLQEKFDIPTKPYFTYVGDMNWNKNLVNMAQAAIKAQAYLVCIGKTFSVVNDLRAMDLEEQHEYLATSGDINHFEQKEFKDFVKLVLHDDRFIFPGYVPDEELRSLYAQALCNVLISRDEGFGLSYLESARQHCPSILADIPVFHEIAASAAYFVDSEQPDVIANAMSDILKKPRSYIAMKEKAFGRSKKFAPQTFTKNIMQALTSA